MAPTGTVPATRESSRLVRGFLTWLVGLAIFVGLPIAAWALAGGRSFVESRARAAFLALVAVLNAFAAFRIPEIGKSRPAPESIVGRQRWAILLLQVLSIGLVLVGPWCDAADIGVIRIAHVRAAGLVLYAAGFLVMHRAEAALGRQFSLDVAIQRDHQLVTSGLYRWIRHPRYLGIVVFSAGISLVFRSIAALLLSAAIVAVLAWRIHDEERLMEREFGDRWRAYARRTWRVLPWIC